MAGKSRNQQSTTPPPEKDKLSVVFGVENLRKVVQVAEKRNVGPSTLVRQVTMDNLAAYADGREALGVFPEDPEMEDTLFDAAEALGITPRSLLKTLFVENIMKYLEQGRKRKEELRKIKRAMQQEDEKDGD